tara:strand:+ start:297 stop:599 length:303 start_codon:yes stop_codon:yes gene_type:complete
MERNKRGMLNKSKVFGAHKSTEQLDLLASDVEDMTDLDNEMNLDVVDGEGSAPDEKFVKRRSSDEYVIKNVRVKLAVILDKVEEVDRKMDRIIEFIKQIK